MDNDITEKRLFFKEGKFLAHVDYETKRTQDLRTHLENVLCLAEQNCPLDILKNLICVATILHDAGKVSDDFQEYMEEVLRSGKKVKRHVDHSSAGGYIAEKITCGSVVSQIIGIAIYSHHGLCDCIDFESGKTISEVRKEKGLDFETIEKRYFEICDKDMLVELMKAAHKDLKKIYQAVDNFVCTLQEGKAGDKEFYLGMYERLILSVLIDSDWSDAAYFSEKTFLSFRLSDKKVQEVWGEAISNFDNYMKKLVLGNSYSSLNQYRNDISDLCYRAAMTENSLYRLTVPTGAGKTFSSLRFALSHAEKYNKQHIFYVAPFNSILEQNAADIREAVGQQEFVLEHHCNVVQENREYEENYRKLTENWDCPIIVTTAVQMLNTLFSGQKSSIRRMYTLCNSVLIFDEVQALPVRCMELFNLAVNFLSQFCNTTVILCSATQPSLAKLKENNIIDCPEMAGDVGQYSGAFKRVEIVDKTKYIPGGMQIEDLKNFVLEQFEKYSSVLVIVNTKMTAKLLYEAVKDVWDEEETIYHLSTNMCPQNRRDELSSIKVVLKEKKKIFCVSTPLIEAGVNFSFECVIRSLSGLDNIIQAAGRCNRHGEQKFLGRVYIIKLSLNIEQTDKLREMKRAQEACERLLYEFHEQKECFDGALDSQAAIRRYYQLYYHELGEEITKYPVSKSGEDTINNSVLKLGLKGTNLVNLLGKNDRGSNQYKRYHVGKSPQPLLRQAFKTAGEYFEVISDDEKVSVVVSYDEEAERLIRELENTNIDLTGRKQILRKLQSYTVGISQYMKDKLNHAIYSPGDSGILVLNKDYYDKKVGVIGNPKINFMFF